MGSLDVYLYDELVGQLTEQSGSAGREYTFAYAPELTAAAESEQIVLSASLRVRGEGFGAMETAPFFEGLLPEEDLRRAAARELKISPGNSFALLGALGRDCAGAVVILPAGSSAEDSSAGVNWLSDEELAELIEELPTRPFGLDRDPNGTRISLAGVQQKAILIRSPSGAFGLPLGNAPSTHLLKPDFEEESAPDLVANEYFCIKTAECAGLPVPEVDLITIEGRPCLLSRRYDRTTDGERTTRLHQEDLCQAVGLRPTNKYEETESGPGFVQLAQTVNGVSSLPGADLNVVLDAAVFNHVIGNADAHGKNFSFLYAEAGPRLAPLYDLVSTIPYGFNPRMAMKIGDTFDPGEVAFPEWFALTEDLEMRVADLDERLDQLAGKYLACAEQVAERSKVEDWHRPIIDEILGVVRARVAGILEEAP